MDIVNRSILFFFLALIVSFFFKIRRGQFAVKKLFRLRMNMREYPSNDSKREFDAISFFFLDSKRTNDSSNGQAKESTLNQ